MFEISSISSASFVSSDTKSNSNMPINVHIDLVAVSSGVNSQNSTRLVSTCK